MTNRPSHVMVYLQTHRDFVQANFIPIAKLYMESIPMQGEFIDIREYAFSDVERYFNPTDYLLRVSMVCISYERVGGVREIVSVCGTAVRRPFCM